MRATWRPWLERAAERWPNVEAFEGADRTLDFATLHAQSSSLARKLLALGLRPGDRVATFATPSAGFVEILHAAQLARLTLVPLNERLQPDELARLLTHAAPAALFYEAGTEALATVVRDHRAQAALITATVLATVPPSSSVLPVASPDDVLTIVYTSGTTGAPKGVRLSNASYEAGARASTARLGCRPADRWLATMPLCHVAGLAILARAALAGMTVVPQHFRADLVDHALRHGHIAFVSLVPTMLAMLLDESGTVAYPASLRAVVLGGGRLPAALVARAAARGLPLIASFGMTETAAQVTSSHAGDAAAHPGSAGHPLDGVEVAIDAADPSGVGEIVVRGSQVCAGYHRAPELSAQALRDGWLHTGDLGRLDGDGRLWVEVRRSDLIVTGGENVHPEEVEQVLAAHAAVADACVYALDDEHWGQRVAAAVVPRSAAAFDADALRAWCRARLAAYKVPRDIVVVESLPRTTSGKLERHLLAAPGTRPAGAHE